MIPIFYRYKPAKTGKLEKASLRDRGIAQLLDGIFLGIFSSVWFFIWSGGKVYSVWVFPVFPIYLLQVSPDFPSLLQNWWWGGFFWSLHLYGEKYIFFSVPSPFLIIIYAGYYIYFSYVYGQTPGKMLKALVILDSKKNRLTVSASIWRWIWMVVSLLPLGLGYWWGALASDKRPWHDYFSDSEVYNFHPYL